MSRKNILMLFAMYGSAFLAGFCENLMNMGLMDIMAEYSIDSITAQWLVTGYMIVSTIGVTAMAFLYRRFSLRPLFFAAAAFAIAGSALGLACNSFALLMIARLIQAAGMGLFIPMMMNTILAIVPKNKLGSFMAIGGCTISFGPAFAPVVCGALVTILGWHSIFIIPLAGMILLAIIGFVYVRNLENTDAHLDGISLALSAVFLFSLSFGLAQLAANAIQGGISLAVAIASGAAFVTRQRQAKHPLIDMSPMARVTFWPAALLVFIAMLITFSLSILLPLYFEGSLGMTALVAGLIILIPVIINSAITLFAGRIMDKKGEWPLLPIGFLLITLGAIAMAFVSIEMSAIAMFFASIIAFCGVGLVFSPSQTAGLKTLPPHMSPFGVALMTTFTQIAACVGPSLFIGIMSGAQNGALRNGLEIEMASARGFSAAIMVAASFAAAGFIVSLLFSHAASKRDDQPINEDTHDKQALASTSLAAIMDARPFVISHETPVFEVMQKLVLNSTNGTPLVDSHGRLAGYISDGDIMRYLAEKHPAFTTFYSFIQAANNQTIDERMKELMELPVKNICTEHAVTINKDANIEEACILLSNHKLDKVPVIDEHGHVIGSLNREEILRHTMKVYLDQKQLIMKSQFQP